MEWDETRAADLMQQELRWADADETLRSAMERMHDEDVHCLIVRPTNAGGLPGIVTSKDMVNLASGHGLKILDQLTVGEVMSRPAVCVPAETSVSDCVQLMRLTGVRRLPVLQGLNVIGLISSTDVFRALVQIPAEV